MDTRNFRFQEMTFDHTVAPQNFATIYFIVPIKYYSYYISPKVFSKLLILMISNGRALK